MSTTDEITSNASDDEGQGNNNNERLSSTAKPKESSLQDLGNMNELPSFIDPDHPLMVRIQEQLAKQLRDTIDKIDIEIREKEEEKKRIAKEKDEIGLKTYNLQQQLVKFHKSIQTAESTFKQREKERIDAETKANQLSTVAEQTQKTIEERENQFRIAQAEGDRLSAARTQAENYRAQLAADTKLRERAAVKAEEVATAAEKEKMETDFLIDKMNEEHKVLQERLSDLDTQIEHHRNQSDDLFSVLSEATSELESMEIMRRQRHHAWESALVSLSRQNDAANKLEQEIAEQRALLITLENENTGYNAKERAEQEKNERLTISLQKNEAESQYITKRIEENEQKREQAAYELSQLQQAAEIESQKLVEVTRENQKAELLYRQSNGVLERLSTQLAEVEAVLAQCADVHRGHTKDAMDAKHTAGQLARTIEERESELSRIANEIAQIRFDQLSVSTHNEQLLAMLEAEKKDLVELESLTKKYDAQIRSQNGEIERKQTEVDRLNKKYDSIIASVEDENLGPLEATIHNLQNEIARRSTECIALQTQWLKTQSEYVQCRQECDRAAEEAQDGSAREDILAQQLLRITKEHEAVERSIKEHDKVMTSLRRDLERLNALIEKNDKKRDVLSAATLELDRAVKEQITKSQRETQLLEQQLEITIAEKESILNQLAMFEQEALQWEKKITLWKETQSALDPNVGSAEMAEIKKEIKIMNYKLSRLKRIEEALVSEMELAVSKRGTALTKLTDAKKTEPRDPTNDYAKRTLNELTKQLKTSNKSNQELEEQIQTAIDQNEQSKEQVRMTEEAIEQLQQRKSAIISNIEEATVTKNRTNNEVLRIQSVNRKYEKQEKTKLESIKASLEREENKIAIRGDRLVRAILETKAKYSSITDEVDSTCSTLLEKIQEPVH